MRFLSGLLLAGLCSIAGLAQAAPVTFDVTPTIAQPSGIVDGYRAYHGCDLATQAKGTLIGPAISGSPFSFQGDSTQTYIVCVVAFNTSSEDRPGCPANQACEGGFATVGNIAATISPPGDTSTTYVCELNPTTGGTCAVSP